MPVTVVVGAQWGDEGKGRIVDVLAQEADLVIRFNGGSNAGHTVINDLGTFKMHLIPSGIFSPRATNIIANGVLVDLEGFGEELLTLQHGGVDPSGRLLVSPRCHMVMPYHKALDRLYEQAKGKASTGTTGRGIGPCFADKVSYNGIRLADFARPEVLREKLNVQVAIKNRLVEALGGAPFDVDEIMSQYDALYSTVEPFVREPGEIIRRAIQEGRNVLAEGAQGAMLDVDWAAYPYCTASSPLAGNVTGGAGIAPGEIDRVIAVAKAYSTRVGNGPMPTELADETGDRLRQAGGEFGTTTGRARRCGWFDAEVVRFSCRLNGATEIALTRLDVLDGFGGLKIATGYTLNGEKVTYADCDTEQLQECQPVLEEVEGWSESTGSAREYDELPRAAQQYVARLAELAGVPITLIGVGPQREQLVVRPPA